MDSYSKDLHLQNKGYGADLSNSELSTLERDHEEAQPRFGVDEPLEVQLRFELGSLVDTHVLIDTDGQRESHWDFVRQEQGRFQTSSEDNTALLPHDKQDDLKSFDNCESWPRSTSQMDTQLFIDAQDDVNMITEVFGGKDKNMVDLVEDDRGLLLPSTFRQCEEEHVWIGEEKEVLEEKAHNSWKEGIVDGAVEASQVPVEKLVARVDCESSADYSESIQSQDNEHRENHEAGHAAADFVKEPLLNKEHSSEVEAALVCQPQCVLVAVSTEEVNPSQELSECSKRDLVDSIQPELLSIDDVEASAQTEMTTATEEVSRQVDGTQVFQGSEKELEADTVGSKTDAEANVDDRVIPAISESMGMESDSDIVSRTSLAKESKGLSTEPVIQTSDHLVETACVVLDTGEKLTTPGGSCLDNTPDNTPGGSCLKSESILTDPVEKQNAFKKHSTEVDSIVEAAQGVATNISGSKETNVLSILEPLVTDVGKVVASCEELEESGEGNNKTGETLDLKLQIASKVPANEPAADSSLSDMTASATMPAEVNEVCSVPATRVLEQGGSYECSGVGGLENTSSVNSLEQAEDMKSISTVADLSVVGTCPSHEDIPRGQLLSTGTPQVSDGHGDLEPADNNMKSLGSSVEGSLDPKQSVEPNNALCNVFTVTDSSSKELVEKQVEAQGASDCVRPEQLANDGNESMLQELKSKQHSGEQNASDFSRFSAEPSLSNENKISTEVSHSGGILHVLLDVHKEGITDESLSKNALDQDQSKMIETEGTTDVQTSNTGDATQQDFVNSGARVAEECSDTYVSGSAGQPVTSETQEDATPPPEKSGKRKGDSSTRNNRLKDSARASPLQVRSDQEHKSAGRKTTPKTAAQKKGIEPLEGFSSPKKSGPKSTGRKKGVVSPMVPDAVVSPAAGDGSQTTAIISKTVLSVNAGHHASPDINSLELAVPTISPIQPFSEPQQVQLRAQILVYGSLIQGAAPEEALMVAAFSNATGVQVGRDPEAIGRAVWEKQWQATVDRIHVKSSRDVLKDSSRANTALVSNSSIATAKASEGGLKPNGSSDMANITIDGRNAAVLPARVSDVSGTKGQASRSKQSTDPALDVSVSRNIQTVAAATPPGFITSTTSRSASSSLNESFSQTGKSRADSQQLTPHTYFPTPPLGPFLTGAPQWFSTTTFPGSWMPQTQAAVYNGPPPLFTHSQAGVSSDQTPETRRSTPSSSGTVMPVTSFGPTLFTPVVGGLSATPTPLADPLQNKQPVSDSRPRKRKKTHCETNVPSADVNSSYATGTAPSVGTQSISTSHILTGQACLGISSPAYLSPPTAPEPLALVVANTPSIVAVHAKEVSAPRSTIMPSAGPPSNEKRIENSANLRNSTSHLLQAQTSAEEAASVAASALSESESLWSKIKAQKNAGFTPDIELQLVSSAAAMATAASVAKAAAAAARAAYEAAIQAKRISECVLEVGKQANEPDSCRLLGDNSDNASQAWRLPESSNSILTAARMASKQRLEAISAARIRAESFESVVRAAELATNAISQVGAVMTMGESAPFTLEMLLEAGPEGLHRLEERIKTKPKGSAIHSPGRRGTPKTTEREKKFSLKITSGNKDAQLDNWTSDSIMASRPENDPRIISELEVGLMTEFSKQKTTDHLAVSLPASRQGLLTTRAEGGLIYEQEVSVSDNKIVKGSLVEVMSDEKGLRGVWFSATAQSVDGEKVFVLYDDLLADDGYSPLEEWIQLKGSSGKAPRVRLAHPNKNIGFEGTRKRRREALGSHKWSVGDLVDAWIRDGWWEGEIKEIIEDGESKAKVFFPGDGDTSLVKTSKLRPSLVWSNGHWVLWHDSKQGKKESSRARTDSHEGETPLAKRQKTEKAQPSCSAKQKLVPASIAEVSTTHKEASPFDSNTVDLPTDFKGFTVDGLDKPKHQGSKVVFGVPRPTKKRKLIEVSKHFSSAKGVPGTNTFGEKVSNNKNEDSSVYAPGVSEASRLDGLKAKKRVLHNPKTRPYKDTDSDAVHLKASSIRSKKEKTFVATKSLVRKNPPNREGLPSLPKNREGKVIKKKDLPPLDKNQPESQEQPENRALSTNAPILETHSSSIAGEDIGKESSLASQNNEKPSDAVQESGTEQPQAAQAIDNNQISALSHKENAKQPSQHAKDSDIQSSTPAIGNKPTSQSLKKKETQLSKDNEEVVHLGKESQKVQGKGIESQPVHEGEKQLEVSSDKQSAVLVNDGEKHSAHPTKELGKSREVGKPGTETWEPRRTSRKIQPTSKLLEGLQTASKLGKNSSSHDRGSRKPASQP